MSNPSLTAHQLQVRATATAPLELRQHTGASLRGAFFGALWGRFCVNQAALACATCPLVPVCPVSALVAPLRDEAPRGRDVPRPFAIRPPIHHAGALGPGEDFTFGLTLFGCRMELFPYIAMALHEMARHGVGRRIPQNNWERGAFTINEVQSLNPLTGMTQTVQASGSMLIQVPNLPITWNDANRWADGLPADQLTLRFLTPLRLVEQKHLVKTPHLRPLVQRLLERHDALAREYGGTPCDAETRRDWIAVAEGIKLEHTDTHWVDLSSFSKRQQRSTPIGGLIGDATYRGELRPLLPLLVWGTVIQAGKDTTKGNGMYAILA